jgi:hypothetical protein
MNTKLTVVAYPAVALLSLLAAVAAHAQSAHDPIDGAAYGATRFTTSTVAARTDSGAKLQMAALPAGRTLRDIDPAYGATVVPATWQRSRTEVRAEAVAARVAGYDALSREGADPQYVVLQRAKTSDTAHVLAGASSSTVK